ncbi:CoA-transferase [Jatrophihabitans sp.]|uniref:CoA-transferase n=1 Tax=Jatrophihabitans sp. TaxID=1932789 RepID=UPI0030C68981
MRDYGGQRSVLERAIRADFALVHARVGDRHGTLVYEQSDGNFNPLCAVAGWPSDHRTGRGTG